MRFDSEDLLRHYAAVKAYPKIHDKIYAMAHETTGTILDLCSSTGLLGQRLKDEGRLVFGLEGNKKAVALGRQYGVTVPTTIMNINRKTWHTFKHWLEALQPGVVLARRCLPELFGFDPELGSSFGAVLRNANVRHLILEGRKSHAQAVNPLACVDDECVMLHDYFKVAVLSGDVAMLVPRE